MNKTIKLTLATLTLSSLLMVTQIAHAGLISSFRSSNWETKPTTKYKIDVMNFDVRIYEWTPADNPNVRCVFAAGNQNSSGVSCYNINSK